MMSKRRVVITGLGTINPVGHNVQETWEGLLHGKSGIDVIKNFECTDDYTSKIAGEIKNFDAQDHFDKKRIKKIDAYTLFALIASKQAFFDAKMDQFSYNPERVGTLVSTGIGGMLTFETEAAKMVTHGPKKNQSIFYPQNDF